MSNPDTKAATQQPPATDVVDGANSTPEQLAEIAEKRRKDTQAAYTKSQQALKALEAENAELMKQLQKVSQVSLTAEEQESLDSLKYNDPEAWRKQLNALELKATNEARANIEGLTGPAKAAAELQFELERRQQVLEEFNASAPVKITEELISDEVPPRITKKLAEGKITFEEFLQEVADYVATGKVVKNDSTLDQPNLGNLGGGVKPSDTKPKDGIVQAYKKVIY